MSERATHLRQQPAEPEPESDERAAPDLAVLSPLADFLDDVESALAELREYARTAEKRKPLRGGRSR